MKWYDNQSVCSDEYIGALVTLMLIAVEGVDVTHSTVGYYSTDFQRYRLTLVQRRQKAVEIVDTVRNNSHCGSYNDPKRSEGVCTVRAKRGLAFLLCVHRLCNHFHIRRSLNSELELGLEPARIHRP
jgi:hypothetical protein